MGQKSSVEKNIVNETLMNSINESVLKNTTECQNDLSTVQNIDLECDPSPEAEIMAFKLKEACLKEGNSASECNKLKACNFEDISQESITSFKASCSVSDEMISNIQADLQADLDAKSKDSKDGFGQALMNMTSPGANTNEKTNIKNSVVANIRNTVTKEFVNKMANKFSSTQNVKIKGTDMIAKGITQKMQLDVVSELASSNKTLSDQIGELKTAQKATGESTVKGLTDIVDSVTGMIASLGGSYMMSILVVVLAGGFVIYKLISVFFGGEGNKPSLFELLLKSPQGMQMMQSMSPSPNVNPNFANIPSALPQVSYQPSAPAPTSGWSYSPQVPTTPLFPSGL